MAVLKKWLGGQVANHWAVQFLEVLKHNWYLGFTSFGGPPSHFRIFHKKFVDKLGWVEEQMYQELFAIAQAFFGPGSTKMLYCLNFIHNGTLAAIFAFLLWSLPGAFGMYGLSVGISHVQESLPRAVYALLSGLNAAVVGIIALAAVELSGKAITDRISRILVFLGAAAGLLYNALWYFPLLMFLGGCACVIYDLRVLHGPAKVIVAFAMRKNQKKAGREDIELSKAAVQPRSAYNEQRDRGDDIIVAPPIAEASSAVQSNITNRGGSKSPPLPVTTAPVDKSESRTIPSDRMIKISWKFGTGLVAAFFLVFIVVMVLRGKLKDPPVLFQFFANMFLAGTIIFGGGPVVIPLLREYVVSEGWVSPRNFLIGLALIQAFPGPNFNFAVYLGGLTARFAGYNAAAGAVLGYIGIFLPGIVTVHGTMGVWSALRGRRWVKSALRGINAAAVGLIYTAVYRLWQIGFIDEGFEAGKSLTDDPWWVVVTATSYVGGRWFGVNAPIAILLGATMGLVRYGVVSQ
ncbi:chromate transporter-domain-containing protein [Xylogone sp. PMI_703]|nr:chromate transporter-domain-containing protein [Xylogone sp. PMI_703]